MHARRDLSMARPRSVWRAGAVVARREVVADEQRVAGVAHDLAAPELRRVAPHHLRDRKSVV